MQISEMEIRSGMERANIRFYEREGFLTPERMDNGYRKYSEEDLQILLRIKLLRSLHISLEEIKALKDRSRDLTETLSQQMVKLEREQQDAALAREICRAMQGDRVSFENLDARKYLEGIDRTVQETGSSYFAVKGDRLPQVFHPWRRFLARMLDLYIYDLLWSAVLAFVFHVNLGARSTWGNLFDLCITIVMMLFLEPLWLRLFGTTPGKAVFGLRIEGPDGSRLSYGEGLERTVRVIGAGMGYFIPIYNLVRLWKSYKLCSEQETQPWDEAVVYTMKDTKWYRGLLYVAACAALFAVLAGILSAQRLPPNRGELTVAEFVENYNYYARFLKVDLGQVYLNEEGKWAEKARSGTVYIDWSNTEKPEYQYALEDGYVTGVSFGVALQNPDDWIASYDAQIILACLALAGAQKQAGLFSDAPSRIVNQILENSFQDFHFTEAGITFVCDVEYTGYFDTQSEFLIRDETVEEAWFSLQFSMKKQTE